MKRILLLAALTLAGCGGPDLEVAKKFQAAQESFARAASPDDFLHAAAQFQEVLDAGVVSGAVLYDQGNAYMQAGKRGLAIAAYRQAQRYRPRDPFLDANLRLALGDAAAAEEKRPLAEVFLFWQSWLSQPEKFHLAGAAAFVTFLLALAALFAPGRGALRKAALAGLGLTLLFCISAAYDQARCEPGRRGVIAVAEAVARKGNGASYEPAFTEPLREGAEFGVLEERGGWLLIRLPGGLEGWVVREQAAVY